LKKKFINIVLSVVITIGFVFLAFYFVRHRLDTIDVAYSVSVLTDSKWSVFILLLVLCLMPVNLLCEAVKWKISVYKLKNLSLKTAFEGILAGVTAGIFLPNRVGEFAGKALSLPMKDFWKGSVLSFYTSFAQLVITLVLGFAAVIYYSPILNFYFGIKLSMLPTIISVACIAFVLFVFFNIHTIELFFKRWEKLHKTISVLKEIDMMARMRIFALSLLRYIVFATQNLLLLYAFEIDISFIDTFFLVAFMYFVMTAIPVFVLTDFPARSSVMILIFVVYYNFSGLNAPYALEAKLIVVSFLIWFINLILPSVPGIYFLNKLSVLRKKDS